MAQFRYKVRDRSGVAVSGVVEAENEKAVSSSLRELGYQIVSVEESRGLSVLLLKWAGRFQRTRPQEMVFFTRQLAMMVRSGLPLVDGIQSASLQAESAPFRKALVLLVQDLKGGVSFSEGLAKYPRFFSNFYASMVRAGEAAGILDQVLERLAEIGEEELALRGRVKGALIYPTLLIAMSVVIVTYLLTAILPRFVEIFEESGAQLPLPTIILLTVSKILQRFWFLIPFVLFGAVFSFRRFARTPQGRYRIHRWLLKLPVAGSLIRKTNLARFSRIMGSLLKSGIQAVAALAITQEVIDNEVMRQALVHILEAVIAGSNLADPFRVSQIFPPTVVQMVSVGERTGTLDEILIRVSQFYDEEVERDLEALTHTLEPFLLLFMGLIVGFIALSVLLPIFQLVKVFKR
ncbi:MAG: type II secretion system F family protein [Candidatus Omnitrophica bacterium]|nr:type II secretion system F family protein [Candidatus Omnitrophota bacterium]